MTVAVQVRHQSKLALAEARVGVGAAEARAAVETILAGKSVTEEVSREVAEHLVDAELSGVESHGVMRILQYAEQYTSGYLKAGTTASISRRPDGALEVNGGGGIGIPAMRLAVQAACREAKTNRMAVVPIRDVGHTGRLGAFAEKGAEQGCFVMIVGGGGRQNWRQVAPYGGRKAILPTNPYCFAAPGGERGPIVADFATSMIAGGWLHAARAAGALVPEGSMIDPEGKPSRDPQDYFNGGAILPKGGAMGYGLALIAEMLCDAVLGPATTEVNWFVLALDVHRFREPHAIQRAAEEIIAEVRACPPAAGFDRVQAPGERERDLRAASGDILMLPASTWKAILTAAGSGRPIQRS